MGQASDKREFQAQFLHRDKWWIAWTDDVPGALTQGATLEEARENLKDAIRLMLEPVSTDHLPDHSEQIHHEVITL